MTKPGYVDVRDSYGIGVAIVFWLALSCLHALLFLAGWDWDDSKRRLWNSVHSGAMVCELDMFALAFALWCSISGVHYMMLASADLWGNIGFVLLLSTVMHMVSLVFILTSPYIATGGCWLFVFSLLPVGVHVMFHRKYIAELAAKARIQPAHKTA